MQIFKANATFTAEILDSYGKLSWNGFRKKYKLIDESFATAMEEHFRALKRDCFHSGGCKKKKKKNFIARMINSDLEDEEFRAFNPIDISGQCPGHRENDSYLGFEGSHNLLSSFEK